MKNTETPASPISDGPKNVSLAPDAVVHTSAVLRELCQVASTALEFARMSCDTDAEEPENLQGRLHVLGLLIGRMGWMADVGLARLGCLPTMHTAEDWMLASL
jgi:hypothetical protein